MLCIFSLQAELVKNGKNGIFAIFNDLNAI